MPNPYEDQEKSPDKPPFPEKNAHYQERKMYDTRDEVGMVRVKGLGDVSAVELPNRQEVQ